MIPAAEAVGQMTDEIPMATHRAAEEAAGITCLDGGAGDRALAEAAPNGKNQRQWSEAMRRLDVVKAYRIQCGVGPDESLDAALRAGRNVNRSTAVDALRAAGIRDSRASLDRYERAHAARGFAGLFDNSEHAGRPRNHDLHATEVAALRAARLQVNRTEHDGSTPEAVRLAARRRQLRPELVRDFLERERTGRMMPRALHNELVAGPAVTKRHRNPTDAALDFLNAPGALMWLTDERTGEERFVRVGDILEADDATINFPVCVPWELGGDPCSERWGVRVARFQWLVAIDRAARFVPGYSYTARPRSSYRAEDLLSLFHGLFREHGVWQRLCLERGTWEANKVGAMLEQLRIPRLTAWSPHQKPFIEGLFNLFWTKLSDQPGQVGRFRGEEEETNRILTSCQRGATDPRQFFPLLGDALQAFDRACHARNEQPVKSQHWGTWVPEERWLAQQAEAREAGRLRTLPAEAAWLFSPERRTWTVQGNTVGGSVQLMEGLSIRFDFAAEWLVEFAGAEVHVHFDPAAPHCEATVVLAQNVRDHRSGEVLGTAVQVNKTARYARRVMGWGDDADLGLQLRQQAAGALTRIVRTILPGRRTGHTAAETRDGLGNVTQLTTGGPAPAGETRPAAAPLARLARQVTPPRRGGVNFRTAETEEEFTALSRRTARLLQHSREPDLQETT